MLSHPTSLTTLSSAALQELEAQNKRLVECQTEVSGRPADFLPRADHARIVASRVEQANLQVLQGLGC